MSNITLSEGEFLGWHLGDGCISKNERYYEYTLTGDIKEELSFYKKIILPKFNNIFDHYFDKKIEIKKYNSVGVCGIYIFDKGFVNLLQNRYELDSGKKINIGLPEVINSKSLKKRFLRGLFDTDGSIYFCKSYSDCDSVYTKFHYRPKIRISTISKKLMEEVNLIMNTLGIKSRLEKPRKQKNKENKMYSVIIEDQKSIKKWINNIGIMNPKHKTKIKIWKKYGFCPPKTNINQRNNILNKNVNPIKFYPKYDKNIDNIKQELKPSL